MPTTEIKVINLCICTHLIAAIVANRRHGHDRGGSAHATAFTKTNKVSCISPKWRGLRAALSDALGDKAVKTRLMRGPNDAGPWQLGPGYAGHGKNDQCAPGHHGGPNSQHVGTWPDGSDKKSLVSDQQSHCKTKITV
jgi:hypothetical protein